MALTATEAATALQDLGRYEERLTLRAAGMTHMVWGLVTAGLFMTYALAEGSLVGAQNITLAFLWMPWVAAGIFATKSLWQHHALTLQREDSGSVRVGLGLTLVFLAIGAALYFGGQAIGWAWESSSLMATVNGLFAAGIGWMHTRHGHPPDLAVGAFAMLATGIGLAMLAPGPALGAGIAAALVGGAWFVSGAVTYQRG